MISTDEEDNVPLFRRGVEARSSKCHVRDWVGIIVSVGCILCGVICIAVISLYKEKVKEEYGIVLDAGSTHTNMFVYKWKVSDIIQGTALVKEIGQCRITDKAGHVRGISDYKMNPEEAGESLQKCIDNKAKRLIPSYVHDKSPIYLGATAGMRLLNETNPATASQILRSVRKTLAKSSFMFEDNYARIISGEEEGISSWVTVNYLNGALNYSLAVSQRKDEVPRRPVGALDMGGASTQITFVSSDSSQSSANLTLYGKNYTVYTHSFLCYGMKEAQRRFLAQLVKEAKYSKKVDNPCGPRGHDRNISAEYLWAAPCVKETIKTKTDYIFSGTGNYSLCAKEVGKLFNFASCRGRKNCSFDGVYLPSTHGLTFLAFSGFYGVVKDLNRTSTSSLDEILAATKNICSKPWSEMMDSPNRDMLATYCFDAQYIFTILSNGYHFNTTKANLRFVNSINNLSVGWALGFMINATNLLPLFPPSSVSIHLIQSGVYLAVVIVGALLTSIGMLICILSTGRIYRQRHLYTGRLI